MNKEKKLHDVSCYLAYLFNHVPILFLKKKIQFEAKKTNLLIQFIRFLFT
jgi:hypothetical protein